jgi:hypothetical protein
MCFVLIKKKKHLDVNQNPNYPPIAIRYHFLHSFLTLSLARGASYSSKKEIVWGFSDQISCLFGK